MEINIYLSIIYFIAGLVLVIYFSEKLVEATVGTSLSFGISAFLISVIFIGFDPENLGVGAIASYENVAGIALGSIFGSAMVAIALALGITALLSPMEFRESPKKILGVPVGAVVLLGAVSYDGYLTRTDGIILLISYGLAVYYLIRLSKRGIDIKPSGERAEVLQEARELGKWKAVGLFILSLLAIIVGSELLVTGSGEIMVKFGLSDTVFGMTILALVVSIEELARELPAAMKGRADIAYGNVIGSILAFFLFNAGIIALVKPVPVGPAVLNFYLPIALGTTLFITAVTIRRQLPRWAGLILVAIYLVFFSRGLLW